MPLFRYQAEEWRILRLLGGFSFLMLAGLTSIGIAAESLFLAELGAAKMAFGIIAGQALVIPIFKLYGVLRAKLRAPIIAPVVVITLAICLSLIFLWERQATVAATIALFVFVPSLAGLIGSEYGRLSAGLMNPRLTRRLFPSIGSIGGFGATFGSFISGIVSIRYSSQWLLLVGAVLLLATLLPAWLATRKLRPLPRRRGRSKTRLIGHRYALLIVISVAAIAAITTLLRFQLGAVALETYGQDGLGVFYSQFSFILNICSVVFTLFLTRLTISKLGAANSLLLYPSVLLIAICGVVFLPTLLLVAIAASSERLFRQNIHRTVASLVKMPLHVTLRTRLAMVSSGTAKPLGTITASLAILLLTGEIAGLPFTLDWPAFSFITLGFSAVTAACLLYVRNRYVTELVGSLHARRLQLDTEDTTLVALDPAVRKMLLGYLTSDLDERSALALTLLEDHLDAEIIETIEQRWPVWNDALKTQAMRALAQDPQTDVEQMARLARGDDNDAIKAIATRLQARSWDDQTLQQSIESSAGQTRAELILAFTERHGSSAMRELVESLASSQRDADRQTAIAVILGMKTPAFDHLIGHLLGSAPQQLLPVLAIRPNPALGTEIIRWLAGDDTSASAKAALIAIKNDSLVPDLLSACQQPRLAAGAIDVLINRPEEEAHEALLQLLEHDDKALRLRVLNAFAGITEPLPDHARRAVNSALNEMLDSAARWQNSRSADDSVLKQIASNETQFALELVFAALDALHEEIPFRRLYLASQSFDARQRALAAETLDEFLPRTYKRRVLNLLEPGKTRTNIELPEQWANWQQQLKDPARSLGTRLRALLQCGLFPGWRYVDLRALAETECNKDTVALTLRNGEAIDIEQVILRGQNLAEQEGDVRISLQAIYAIIAENPRCGGLWLRGLAQRVPEQAGVGGEITRSEFMSLATRTFNEDQAAASDMEIWQRVFFLRTMAMTQALPAGRLRLLAEIARTLSAEAGDLIINEGRLGNHFYMVCSGKLEVSAKDATVTQLGPSDAFGAMSLMLGARRSFTVRATEKSELLTIDRVDFLDLIDAHPSLARSFSRTLAERIRAARQTHDKSSGEQPA